MGLTHFSRTYTIERQITKSGKNMRETDHLEDQGVDRRIQKTFLHERGWRAWTGFIWLRKWTSSCERGKRVP
jgi:hypothetical protein